jgi:hypothetical protein
MIFENISNDSLDFYELKIMMETNKSDGFQEFTKEMLVFDSNKDGEGKVLNKLPYFTYKYKYPLTVFKRIGSYQDRINLFFNESVFKNKIFKEEYLIEKFTTEEEKNLMIEENIMTMIEILFPTKFPVINNIHTSHQFISLSRSLKPLDTNIGRPKIYSHLNINNNKYTINKIILYNDILNHPMYNKLINETYSFQTWCKNTNNEMLIEIAEKNLTGYKDLPKEYLSFENSFLTKYRKPKRVMNNQLLQDIIDDHKTNDENVKTFHKCIEYFYKRYILGYEINETDQIDSKNIELFESILNTPSFICTTDSGKNAFPTKEIYLSIQLHNEKLNDDIVKNMRCSYYEEQLGEDLEKLLEGVPFNSALLHDEQYKSIKDKPIISKEYMTNNQVEKIYAEDVIKDVNTTFVSLINNKWENVRNVNRKTIKEKIEEFLKDMKKKLDVIENNDYKDIKSISFKVDDLIENIMTNQLLPNSIENIDYDYYMNLILSEFTKHKQQPKLYESQISSLLLHIDNILNSIKSQIIRYGIQANEMKSKGTNEYVEEMRIYQYNASVLKMFEFIIIYVIYKHLLQIHKNIDVVKYKMTAGKKKTKKKKRNKNGTRKQK